MDRIRISSYNVKTRMQSSDYFILEKKRLENDFKVEVEVKKVNPDDKYVLEVEGIDPTGKQFFKQEVPVKRDGKLEIMAKYQRSLLEENINLLPAPFSFIVKLLKGKQVVGVDLVNVTAPYIFPEPGD